MSAAEAGSGEHRVLALKWRPHRLDDIVGQPHVVRTLKNALTSGKVGHAYLFAGPRGVGKTTSARILARAVNCEKGLGPEPCGECPTCRDILAGRALDVIEIDAASTGKVDDVRDLREVVRLAPARARKKVFIIDEAHMLTAGASNALLKTLEEPPAHIMFILATTDANDLITTIRSRCQRFDFHPLGPATVSAHLKRIADAEGIKADDEALALIAKTTRGAMRDAQTLLEQAASFVADRVTAQEIRTLLGLVEREWVERFLGVLHERDMKGAMGLLDDLIEAGREPRELLEEVVEELRDALMLKLGADAAPLGTASYLGAPERRDWFGEEELLSLLGHARRALEELSWRQVAHPRVAAEVAVARLMRRERALSWAEVEEQLARLEGRPGPGPAGAYTGPAQPRPSAPPAGPSFRPASAPPSAAPSSPPAQPQPRPAPPRSGPVGMTVQELRQRWPGIVSRLSTRLSIVKTYLANARVTGVEGAAITVELSSSFQYDGLRHPEAFAAAQEALSEVLGMAVTLSVVRSAAPGVSAAPAPAANPVSRPAPGNGAPAGGAVAAPGGSGTPEWVEDEPLVKAALKVFRARFIEAKKAPPAK